MRRRDRASSVLLATVSRKWQVKRIAQRICRIRQQTLDWQMFMARKTQQTSKSRVWSPWRSRKPRASEDPPYCPCRRRDQTWNAHSHAKISTSWRRPEVPWSEWVRGERYYTSRPWRNWRLLSSRPQCPKSPVGPSSHSAQSRAISSSTGTLKVMKIIRKIGLQA